MKLGEVLEFRKDLYFEGAVQADWFYDPEKASKVAENFVFHGKNYFGVEAKRDSIDTISLVKTLVGKLGKEDSNDALHNAASGMSLSADGKYLFCTTAGENTVTMYAVDQETGLLTKKFTLPISGDYPKDLMIFPDNKHIAIANHASNSITVFTVDYEKNIIMMNEKPRKIETPNCIHIWPVPDTWEQLD